MPDEVRLPPYSEASERGLLGSVLLEASRVLELCHQEGLDTSSFYVPAHQLVWRAVKWLEGKRRGVDVLTVANALREHGKLDEIGGQVFLDRLIESCAVSAHAEFYLEEVVSKWMARMMLEVDRDVDSQLYTGSHDPRDVLATHIQRLVDLSSKRRGKSRSKGEVWDRVLKQVQAARSGKHIGLPAPWEAFTKYTGGAPFGGVTLIVGRSKTRKSYLAHQWGLYAAVTMPDPIPGVYYPLEDGQEVAMTRAACALAGVDAWRFRRGQYTDEELEAVQIAAKKVKDSPYEIREGRNMSLAQWRLDVARGVAQHGWRFVIIDAFKDQAATGGNVEADAKLAAWNHDLAREFNLACLVVQHVKKNRTLNRPVKDRDWEKIIKEDARGASQITDGARMIVALQCQLKRDSEGFNHYTHYVLDCLDNNNGPTAAGSLDLDPSTGVFTEAPSRRPFSDWTDKDDEKEPWYKKIGEGE